MALTPVKSSHLAGYEYQKFAERLVIQFTNADKWEYFDVPSDLIEDFKAAGSMGVFFSNRIRGLYAGQCVHHGTLQERAEIWLRSKEAREFEGQFVALGAGNPVRVLGWGNTEGVARSAVIAGNGDVVVVFVEMEQCRL